MVTEAVMQVSQPQTEGVTLNLSREDAAYIRLLTGFKDSCAEVATSLDSPYRNRITRRVMAQSIKRIRQAFDRAGFNKGEAKRVLGI